MSASAPTISHSVDLLSTQASLDPSTPKSKEFQAHADYHHQHHQIPLVLPSPDDSESDEIEGAPSESRSSSDTTLSTNSDNINSANTTTNTSLNKTVCHGRVKDPEAMVSKTWWKTVFSDQLYLQTDGDVVEDPAITLEEVRLLEGISAIHNILQASFSPDRTIKVLDLCCGQGRHTLQLAELYPSLELHGHDQSEFLIQLARSRAAASASSKDDVPLSSSPSKSETTACAQINFTIGDCRSIPFPDQTFDLVLMMGNSFGYFSNDKDDETVLAQISRVLCPGGVVVLDITDGAYQRENFSPRGWEWVDDEMLVCRERWLSEDRKRLVCREVVIKTALGVIRDQFYQERLYDGEEMRHLLRSAGLKRLCEADEEQQQAQGDHLVRDLEIKTGKEMSQRGEDLGMMDQRNFVVAVKPTTL
ncbi:hypothetical protein BGZ97_007053 [Linnemannia gamsii]|jgi:SAM-dependent methyltransferase|uniref:Methyltransferase domain-containing protein n=1 Tax=Linnemannia gamsii TaxID=64522 RepID=A0A9P6RF78_9FUNG|nr:hypothetical protein BGZ97_007053 [Linnemannia gamsii]